MMKKLFLLICFIFLCLPVLAEYKPIPAYLSTQYKAEMEQIINDEYPQVINNVNQYVNEANNYYQNILNNGYNYLDYVNIVNLNEICIPAADLDLYSHLMRVTQEKYLNTPYTPIGTDSVNPIYDFLYPYFRDNNIDITKLNNITNYEQYQNQKILLYIEHLQKLASKN